MPAARKHKGKSAREPATMGQSLYSLNGEVIKARRELSAISNSDGADSAENRSSASSSEFSSESRSVPEVTLIHESGTTCQNGVTRVLDRVPKRGIPKPITLPSQTLIKSLTDQIPISLLPSPPQIPNPLPSLTKLGGYLSRGAKGAGGTSASTSPASFSGSASLEDGSLKSRSEVNSDDDDDDFAFITDPSGGSFIASSSTVNGLAHHLAKDRWRSYTRSSLISTDTMHSKAERSILVCLYPDEHTRLRIWDLYEAQSAGSKDLRWAEQDMQSSTIWEQSPQEIFALPCLERSESNVIGATKEEDVEEEWILDATLIKTTESGSEALSLVSLILQRRHSTGVYGMIDNKQGKIRVEVSSLTTGKILMSRSIGEGSKGKILANTTSIVAAIASNQPFIRILNPASLENLCQSLTHCIGVNTRTGIPVVALSKRMLAFTTTEPARPNSEWAKQLEEQKFGTIVTKRSVKAAYDIKLEREKRGILSSSQSSGPYSPESAPSLQAMVMSTAAGVSTEVFKGVWSGLKGLGQAAVDGASKSSALSKSAPVVSDFAWSLSRQPNSNNLTNTTKVGNGDRDITAVRRQIRRNQPKFQGAAWVKLLDMGKLSVSRRRHEAHHTSRELYPKVLAHFALPSFDRVPLPGYPSPNTDLLSFSPDGVRLAAGIAEGTSVAILEIRPNASEMLPAGHGLGQVWLRYELRRGVTPARISQISWDRSGSWVSVGTRKTIHIFSLNSDNPADRTAVAQKPSDQQPLSSRKSAQVKLRLGDWVTTSRNKNSSRMSAAPLFCFLPSGLEGKDILPRFRSLGYAPGNDTLVKCLGINAKQPSRETQKNGIVSLPTAMWTLPHSKEVESALRMNRQTGTNGSFTGSRDKPILGQIEIDTFDAESVIPSIYKDRLFDFKTWFSDPSIEPQSVRYIKPIEPSEFQEGPSPLQSALDHELDKSGASPVAPALPNGIHHPEHHWHTQPIKVIASAREIVKKRRGSSFSKRAEATGVSSSYSDRIGLDEESGFMVELDTQQTPEIKEEESWEDDLVAGAMDA